MNTKFIYCCRFTPELFLLSCVFFLCIYCLSPSGFTHNNNKAFLDTIPLNFHTLLVVCASALLAPAMYRSDANSLLPHAVNETLGLGWRNFVAPEATMSSGYLLEVLLSVFDSLFVLSLQQTLLKHTCWSILSLWTVLLTGLHCYYVLLYIYAYMCRELCFLNYTHSLAFLQWPASLIHTHKITCTLYLGEKQVRELFIQ